MLNNVDLYTHQLVIFTARHYARSLLSAGVRLSVRLSLSLSVPGAYLEGASGAAPPSPITQEIFAVFK